MHGSDGGVNAGEAGVVTRPDAGLVDTAGERADASAGALSWRLVGRPVVYALLTIFGAMTAVFVYTRVLPGDAARLLLPKGRMDPGMVEAQRQVYHLDASLPEQYVQFLGDTVRGRFGVSFRLHEPVGGALKAAVGHSLMVVLVGLAVSAGLLAFLWLVLDARLPAWATTAVGSAYGALGVAAVVWSFLAAHDALPDGLSSVRYRALLPPARDAIGDGWPGTMRAGLLVGIATGGLMGCAAWLAWRRLRAQRRAARAVGLAGHPVTWRRTFACAMGGAWGWHVLIAAAVLYVVMLAEQAALLRDSVAPLYDISATVRDYPMVFVSWLTAALFVTAGALALSLLAALLDPMVVWSRRMRTTAAAPRQVAG